ncbi:MAG: hypothetical protein ACRD94_03925 [Nitrosopumilaceae archaeon]
MGELEEFAEALLDQLSVEINEEKEIAELADKISDDASFTVKFDDLEKSLRKVRKKIIVGFFLSDSF